MEIERDDQNNGYAPGDWEKVDFAVPVRISSTLSVFTAKYFSLRKKFKSEGENVLNVHTRHILLSKFLRKSVKQQLDTRLQKCFTRPKTTTEM